jgi:hypothetical protein
LFISFVADNEDASDDELRRLITTAWVSADKKVYYEQQNAEKAAMQEEIAIEKAKDAAAKHDYYVSASEDFQNLFSSL